VLIAPGRSCRDGECNHVSTSPHTRNGSTATPRTSSPWHGTARRPRSIDECLYPRITRTRASENGLTSVIASLSNTRNALYGHGRRASRTRACFGRRATVSEPTLRRRAAAASPGHGHSVHTTGTFMVRRRGLQLVPDRWRDAASASAVSGRRSRAARTWAFGPFDTP